ncbi:hypothetical protein FDN13_08865 [Caloramator sp. E03]|uniref:hypothetical protein n=1 Tax=Caloramator sp. E03 TaxID=2576307 RepID=UPI0011107045|nr:hypothetical protein [Caloramator sp. E03]QCX33796.1 hypothetical protein FDN13_08865 [Caloramator sp. E03]
MSDYRINFGTTIGPADINKLYGMLEIIGDNDSLNIVLESADAHQTDRIMKILDDNDFYATTKGSNDGYHYNITARRRT